jgi:hypothetical protein
MDRTPRLTETQWRTVFDTLEAATPIGATFETDKDELAWYRRSEVIQSIKSCFGWRSRTKHKALTTEESDSVERGQQELLGEKRQ